MVKYFWMIFCLISWQQAVQAQQKDSVGSPKDSTRITPQKNNAPAIKDSTVKKKHDPHKATLYSAILPGAGQVYNKKYWKVPIVYVALGVPAYAYFYNKSWYQKCQYALAVSVNSSQFYSLASVDDKLRGLAAQGPSATNYLINYRNDFRKNQDYAALFFLIFWGLNIVDATVDAHLMGFNVTNDLSLKLRPAVFPGTNAFGVSFVFDIHKSKTRGIDAYH